eukprot:7378940-Prymnesium_polylepis.1
MTAGRVPRRARDVSARLRARLLPTPPPPRGSMRGSVPCGGHVSAGRLRPEIFEFCIKTSVCGVIWPMGARPLRRSHSQCVLLRRAATMPCAGRRGAGLRRRVFRRGIPSDGDAGCEMGVRSKTVQSAMRCSHQINRQIKCSEHKRRAQNNHRRTSVEGEKLSAIRLIGETRYIGPRPSDGRKPPRETGF